MTGKHPDPKRQPVDRPDDLEENPGIGQSKGIFARAEEDPRLIRGESTMEGDRENDASLGGGVDPEDLGRRNK